MKIERTKNASRNMIFGFLLKIYQLMVPFIMRTVMVYFLGVQYLGLNSLFTSVIQVLNLAELGVGTAMTFSMYKPIAEDDTKTICALMNLYKIYYRIIGLVICVVGLCLIPFVPNLIQGDIPDGINIYILYLMNLGTTVLSYWLFAYKNCILTAHQRDDITSKVLMSTESIKYFLQLLVLAFFHNYYYYLLVVLGTQILTNVLTEVYADKMYPDYQAKGRLPKEEVKGINNRIRDLFTSKIGGVIVESSDTLVISAFLGLTVLAVYQNYFYLITAISSIIAIILNACRAGIGNSLVVETDEKNFIDLKKFSFIIGWLGTVCSACFLNLFQPFMEMWMGKELLLDYSIVICLCIYFYVYEFNNLLNLYKDAAGIWYKDKLRTLLTALTNLVLNLTTVKFLGLYGIILSTVISTVIVGMPWLLSNLFTTVFDMKYMKEYIKLLIEHAIVALLSCVFSYFCCSLINGTGVLVIAARLCIVIVVVNTILFVAFGRTDVFYQCLELLNRISKGRIPVVKKLIK